MTDIFLGGGGGVGAKGRERGKGGGGGGVGERGRIGGVRMRRAGKSNREDGDGMSPEGAGNEEEVRAEDP